MDYPLKNWLAAILIMMGIFAFVVGLKRSQRKASSAAWPSARGVVVESSIVTKQRPRNRMALGRKQTIHRANVEFSYNVNGTKLLHRQSHFGGQSPSRVIKKYPAGAKVSVFYDPEDVNDSILEPESPASLNGTLVFGSVFFLAGIILVAAPAMSHLQNSRRTSSVEQ